MNAYTVHVTRGEKYWVVHVPEVERYTQARHLREVDPMARDLVTVMTGAAPDSFELDVHIEMPVGVSDHLRLAEKLRAEARHAQSEAAMEVRTAARLLRDRGIPLRDIGILLDVSYQRAGQLVGKA